jgi:gustatory receptor
MAASIHEASKFPIQIISSIPPEGWCNEMQRFMDQARAQDIALSGMKFFYLTRKTILSVSFDELL